MSINMIQIVCDFIRAKTVFSGNIQLSREVNFLMTFRLMHASVSKFFDRVPLGRILNRFMKDVGVVDNMLAWSTSFLVVIL
jgi:ABC-type multidrug transport system fused ATPase/permease subunit